ncbi:MAG: hypothetical protein IT165_09985 [Bryobacterales bacterium]|nr:hypothetical protein [Bryobacterales bacterium]
MAQPVCFVVMPFRPELNFFYLYTRAYLEDKFKIRVERGDTHVLTKAVMDKIREQIIDATFLIGDVTGSNPNVFFELGIAQAIGRPVIYLTQDPPDQVPVDVRQFEFIQYDLGRHEEFLAKLDNAVRNLLGRKYEPLYEKSRDLLRQLNTDTGHLHAQASREEFQMRLVRAEENEGLPPFDDEKLMARFLLPKVLQDATDLAVMQRVTEWLAKYNK